MPLVNKKEFDASRKCPHPEHEAPKLLVMTLKPGLYTWECPECKEQTTFTIPVALL